MDQPLLHPRPDAREKLRQMDRRPGRDLVHGQLEIGRREHRRRDPGRLCRGATGCGQRDPRPARRRGRAHDRLLRRRDDARRRSRLSCRQGRGGQGRERDLLHRAGRFRGSWRSETVPRRRYHGDVESAHCGDGRARWAGDGGDVQPAARARPDLELCRQQLPDGQRSASVRPAPLERRCHQPSGRVAP